MTVVDLVAVELDNHPSEIDTGGSGTKWAKAFAADLEKLDTECGGQT